MSGYFRSLETSAALVQMWIRGVDLAIRYLLLYPRRLLRLVNWI